MQVISAGMAKTHLLREKLGCKELTFYVNTTRSNFGQLKHKETQNNQSMKHWF